MGLNPPEHSVSFATLDIRGEASSSLRPTVDPVYAIHQLASNRQFQSEMKLSAEDIATALAEPWSVQESLKNCELPSALTPARPYRFHFSTAVEGQPYDISRRSSPRRVKLALAELARPESPLSSRTHPQNGQRGIDVSDLRQALGEYYSFAVSTGGANVHDSRHDADSICD